MSLQKYQDHKDSGVEWLGEIPHDWQVLRIKNIGSSTIGLTYSPDDVTDENSGIPVLRASNIQNGRLDWGDTVFVSKKTLRSANLTRR